MDDKLVDHDNGDLLPNQSEGTGLDDESTSRHGNQDQPCTSYSSGAGSSSQTTDEPLIGASLSLRDEHSKSSDSTKHQKCKKACTFKRPFTLCEKRTLSSSSENLLGEDMPRKNFKFCRGLMKRWFHGSQKSDREILGAGSYEEDQNAFRNIVGQISIPGSGSEGSDTVLLRKKEPSSSTITSDRLSGSCSGLPTEIEGTVIKDFSERQCPSPGKPTEVIPSDNEQAPVLDAAHSEALNRDDDLDDIIDDFSLSNLHLNCLPPQVLAHIFSYLTLRELLGTAALVCKHWERMSHFSSLWLKIRLREYTNVADEDLMKLCSRHCNVGLLDLSDCLRITDNGLEKTLMQCKMLREVFLIRCSQLMEKAFLSIADYCLNLTHIDVSGCSGLTDKALQGIAERCPLLQKVRLKQCPLVSDSSLWVVAHSCPRLKILTFMDNDKITDATLEALATHSHNLEFLCLQNCGIGPPGLVHITKLHLLRKLDLSNLLNLTSDSVKQVARHCRLLDTLNLSLSRDVRDDCVSCVAMFCKRLTTLFLISCAITDRALYSIGDNGAFLEHLDVSWCTNITGLGSTYVSDRCPRLKYLGLIRCNKVSDTVVERMVQDHPAIHYSTFLLDSKRLIDKAREQGFVNLE